MHAEHAYRQSHRQADALFKTTLIVEQTLVVILIVMVMVMR